MLHDREMMPVAVHQSLRACCCCMGCWWVTWTDSLLDSLMPTAETFHPWKHCSTTWGSVSTYSCQPMTDVCSWHAFHLQKPHGPSLPVTVTFHYPWQSVDWRNHPVKNKPTTSSAAIYWVNVWLSLPHNMQFFYGWYLHSNVTTTGVNHLWTALVINMCNQHGWHLILARLWSRQRQHVPLQHWQYFRSLPWNYPRK
jgi:hypothetical protein